MCVLGLVVQMSVTEDAQESQPGKRGIASGIHGGYDLGGYDAGDVGDSR